MQKKKINKQITEKKWKFNYKLKIICEIYTIKGKKIKFIIKTYKYELKIIKNVNFRKQLLK